jgi:hypothetical protein
MHISPSRLSYTGMIVWLNTSKIIFSAVKSVGIQLLNWVVKEESKKPSMEAQLRNVLG